MYLGPAVIIVGMTRNEELLGQVSHMKDELAALQKSEEDMIEYQRSLESSTRLVVFT